jgi:hypothetical protein
MLQQQENIFDVFTQPASIITQPGTTESKISESAIGHGTVTVDDQRYQEILDAVNNLNWDYFVNTLNDKLLYFHTRVVGDDTYLWQLIYDTDFAKKEFASVQEAGAIAQGGAFVSGAVTATLVAVGSIAPGIGTAIAAATSAIATYAVEPEVAYVRAGQKSDSLGHSIDSTRNSNDPNKVLAGNIYNMGLKLLHRRPKLSENPTANLQFAAAVDLFDNSQNFLKDFMHKFTFEAYEEYIAKQNTQPGGSQAAEKSGFEIGIGILALGIVLIFVFAK